MSTRSDMLLADLSNAIGIPDLKFDDQNMCSLLIDDEFRITLLANSEEYLFIYGILGQYPNAAPEEFALELLTANMLFAEVSGPYIGYEPVSRTLLLAMATPLDGLHVGALETRIEHMVQSQENIRNVLKARNITLEQAST